MYPEVRAEMARKHLFLRDLSVKLHRTIGTISLKLRGESPLTLQEAIEIKEALDSDLPLEVLFRTDAEA